MWKHPPGDEVYRKGAISVFEVDGKKNKVGKVQKAVTFYCLTQAVRLEQMCRFLSPDLLPEPVFTCQAFPGPQNAVLRCGALPVLCHD